MSIEIVRTETIPADEHKSEPVAAEVVTPTDADADIRTDLHTDTDSDLENEVQDAEPLTHVHDVADGGGLADVHDVDEAAELPDAEAPTHVHDVTLQDPSVHDEVALAGPPFEPDHALPTPTAEAALAALAAPAVESPEDARREPLFTAEAEQDYLSRWTAVQTGFVEDPHAAVEAADAHVDEIATTIQQAFQERRGELAADWRNGSPDTEQLRLALKSYRALIGLILPK